MAYDPSSGQPNNPGSEYGNPSNPYGAPPENPYGSSDALSRPPENPYSTPPQNPYAGPPQNPYGVPSYGSDPNLQPGPAFSPPANPLPLGEAMRNLPSQYVKVLTRPGAMTFAEEMGKASWNIVWVQLIALAIISSLLGYLATFIATGATSTTNGTSPISTETIRSITGGVSLGYIIIIPVFFFIGMGIIYGLARAFGGQGRFVTQSYTYLLFDTPLSIISSLLALIPIAGGFIALAVGICRIVLAIFSVMAVHRLSGGKASAVVLIPIAVGLVLACAAAFVLIAFLVNAAQHH